MFKKILRIIFTLIITLFIIYVFYISLNKYQQKKILQKSEFLKPPKFYKIIKRKGYHLFYIPFCLQYFKDKLYVSYFNSNFIDVYQDLKKIKTIYLYDKKTPVYPINFALTENKIFVIDKKTKAIKFFSMEGKFLNSFALMPDKKKIYATALAAKGSILYFGDTKQKAIYAIATEKIKNVSLEGELITEIPNKKQRKYTFSIPDYPVFLYLTYDGRLVNVDANRQEILIYTCAGQYISKLKKAKLKLIGPRGVAIDNIASPLILREQTFDPSGFKIHGRYHIVDSYLNTILVYDRKGNFLFNYSDTKILNKPQSIAIDSKKGIIYIANSGNKNLVIYKYNVGY